MAVGAAQCTLIEFFTQLLPSKYILPADLELFGDTVVVVEIKDHRMIDLSAIFTLSTEIVHAFDLHIMTARLPNATAALDSFISVLFDIRFVRLAAIAYILRQLRISNVSSIKDKYKYQIRHSVSVTRISE